jgi:hypothetical protein
MTRSNLMAKANAGHALLQITEPLLAVFFGLSSQECQQIIAGLYIVLDHVL